MSGLTKRALKGAAAAAVAGILGLGFGHLAAPRRTAELWDSLRDHMQWSAASCVSAALSCIDARADGLRRQQAEAREIRAQTETGLRSLEAEELRIRNLLDANMSQQAMLKGRVNDALLRGAERLAFLGRSYSRADVEAQAASLVAEQRQFEALLAGTLPPRREALLKARQQALLAENQIATTLATVAVDQALLSAERSLARTDQLLSKIAGAEERMVLVLGSVRSTLELVDHSSDLPYGVLGAAKAPAFDFEAWRTGRAAAADG